MLLLSGCVSDDDGNCLSLVPSEFFLSIVDENGFSIVGDDKQYRVEDINLEGRFNDVATISRNFGQNDSIVMINYNESIENQTPYFIRLGKDRDTLVFNVIESTACGARIRSVENLNYNEVSYEENDQLYIITKE